MNRRLLGFLILIGVLGFMFKDKIVPKSDTLTIGMIQEPNILNPILELNSEAKQITNLVFDGLTNPADIENENSTEKDSADEKPVDVTGSSVELEVVKNEDAA